MKRLHVYRGVETLDKIDYLFQPVFQIKVFLDDELRSSLSLVH